MIVVLNPGHVFIKEGDPNNTPGKRSPDSKVIEAVWNLDVANRVQNLFKAANIETVIAHAPTEKESLTYPVKVTNSLCDKHGAKHVLFVSIHVNAAGNGQWLKAQGWSIWTTKGVTRSDELATTIWNHAKKEFTDRVVRADYQDSDPDYEANFYVIRKVNCPAVLVENFFMDNKEDCLFLQTEEGKNRCAKVIFEGVKEYIDKHISK